MPLPRFDGAQIHPIGANVRLCVGRPKDSVVQLILNDVSLQPTGPLRMKRKQFAEWCICVVLDLLKVHPDCESVALVEWPCEVALPSLNKEFLLSVEVHFTFRLASTDVLALVESLHSFEHLPRRS